MMDTATQEEPPAPARPWAIDEDGSIYNPESGEVYDPSEVESLGIPLEDLPLPGFFRIECREDAEKALEKKAQIEATIAALNLRLEAVTEGITAQIKNQRRRLSYWDWRYESNLIGFARTTIKKGKTAQFDHGKVAFRSVPATAEIIDMSLAVDWMARWKPEAVKRKEWVTATDVKATIKEVATEIEVDVILPFIVFGEARESVAISTGVEKKGGSHGK